MEKELDPSVIKATQTSLGKYVKRPPLTEKLLKKPPFRFLHDIVTTVLKTTGFFEGLFDEEELVSDNVKDRENKIVFLNKVISVVGLTIGKTLATKPSKIVAGQEPEKTNELLQCIAQALDKNLSSDEAVRKFKEGLKPSKPQDKRIKESGKQIKKANESNKLTAKSNEKLTNSKKESEKPTPKNDNEKTNHKTKQKDKGSTKPETGKKPTQSKLAASKKPSVEKTKNEVNPTNLNSNDISEKNTVENTEVINDEDDAKFNSENQLLPDTIDLTTKSESAILEQNKQYNHDTSFTIVENGLNSSLSSQDFVETENHQTDGNDTLEQDKNKKIVEQNIASEKIEDSLLETIEDTSYKNIPDFNKIDEKNNTESTLLQSQSEIKTVVRPLSVRPSSSRPGAPRPRDKHENIIAEAENILVGKVNIIAESSPNEEDEDASILIVEEPNNSKAIEDDQEKLQASLNEHGHLVQQILDSQKEYSQISGKTEIEWQFGAKKARDALNKEIEQLRFDIQALSRVANPLGKLLDHIQEDVEVMRQELNQWTKTYEETSKELFKQKAQLVITYNSRLIKQLALYLNYAIQSHHTAIRLLADLLTAMFNTTARRRLANWLNGKLLSANEESLFTLYAKVKQLGSDIEEKHDKINDLKIIIHKNSHRIDKLLANGNVQ